MNEENFQGTASMPLKSVIILMIALGTALGHLIYDTIKSII